MGQREWFEGLITSPSQPTYVSEQSRAQDTLPFSSLLASTWLDFLPDFLRLKYRGNNKSRRPKS